MPDTLGDVLVACLREATAPEPSATAAERVLRPEDAPDLLAAAAHHGIAPAVHRVLGRSERVPEDVRGKLRDAFQRQCQVHLRALGDLAELARMLDGLGVRWAAVKGPVLTEAVYRRIDVRSYVDLDLVVHRTDFSKVLDALEAAGAQVRDRNWTMIREHARGEITLALRHGSALDLHWHLFNEAEVRRSFSVSMDDFLDRTVRVSLNGVATPTFDAVDTLVYLAAHAGLGGGYRLVWFKDIEQVISQLHPDWDAVLDRARTAGLGLLVATMLRRAQVVGAEVPAGVLDTLAPARGWRQAMALVDRLSPPQRSFGHQLSGRTVVAATRDSGRSSARALARTGWDSVLRPVLTDRNHPWRRRLRRQPPEPKTGANPLWRPLGEETDRQAFLRLLAESATEP